MNRKISLVALLATVSTNTFQATQELNTLNTCQEAKERIEGERDALQVAADHLRPENAELRKKLEECKTECSQPAVAQQPTNKNLTTCQQELEQEKAAYEAVDQAVLFLRNENSELRQKLEDEKTNRETAEQAESYLRNENAKLRERVQQAERAAEGQKAAVTKKHKRGLSQP